MKKKLYTIRMQNEKLEKEKRIKTSRQISNEEVKRTINITQNWKAPVNDRVPKFWWKQLTATHIVLTSELNFIIDGKDAIPE